MRKRRAEKLERVLQGAVVPPSIKPFHRALVSLPWLFAIVTGSDQILEASCKEVGLEPKPILSVEDIGTITPARELGIFRQFPPIEEWAELALDRQLATLPDQQLGSLEAIFADIPASHPVVYVAATLGNSVLVQLTERRDSRTHIVLSARGEQSAAPRKQLSLDNVKLVEFSSFDELWEFLQRTAVDASTEDVESAAQESEDRPPEMARRPDLYKPMLEFIATLPDVMRGEPFVITDDFRARFHERAGRPKSLSWPAHVRWTLIDLRDHFGILQPSNDDFDRKWLARKLEPKSLRVWRLTKDAIQSLRKRRFDELLRPRLTPPSEGDGVQFYAVDPTHQLPLDAPPEGAKYPCIVLSLDMWNDRGFLTFFKATLHRSPKGPSLLLGHLRILRRGAKEFEPTRMPYAFLALDAAYCSFGAQGFYSSLKGLNRLDTIAILRALRDIVLDAEIERQFESEIGFNVSLLRDRAATEIVDMRRLLGLDEPSPPRKARPDPGDSNELTLTIKGSRRELRHGNTILWSDDSTFDWTQKHFDNYPNGPVTLAEARSLLPGRWAQKRVEVFGDKLADLLFTGSARKDAEDALRHETGKTVRLILDLDAEAAAVPWEYLRIGGGFLLEGRFSFLRHVDSTMKEPPSLHIERPTAIIFASASPPLRTSEPSKTGSATESLFDDSGHFDVDAHRTQITDALRDARITITDVSRCTQDKLRATLTHPDELASGLHFLGHGEAAASDGKAGSASLLVLSKDLQNLEPLEADTLSSWLCRSHAKFVFLGACHSGAVPSRSELSGLAWKTVKSTGLPVVAMQMAVPQAFSTQFAAWFYKKLVEVDFNLEEAVCRARAFDHNGRHAFGIPVLFADRRSLTTAAPTIKPSTKKAWATFNVINVATLSAEEARQKWRECPLPPDAADAVDQALREEAAGERAGGAAAERHLFPAPPPEENKTELTARLLDLLSSVSDKASSAKLAEAIEKVSTPAPLASTAALTGQRIEPRDDHALAIEWDKLPEGSLDELHDRYSFPDHLVQRTLAELKAGRHVLLIGPAGTGKTTLAKAIIEALGYKPHIATASADWTNFEVVGGYFPQASRDPAGTGAAGRMEFVFRPGVFLEAVLENWRVEAAGDDGVTVWRRSALEGGVRGSWLLLDELNRADMDRAMGGLFTALETRLLRVPAAAYEQGAPTTVEIPIPCDFRIVATLNGVDRHYLFRLSDALKRRFAFIEVPVTSELADEWAKVEKAAKPLASSVATPIEENALRHELRRFIYLARVFYPVGTAQLLAALRFLNASQGSGLPAPDRLHQAIAGSVLPGLEDVGDPALRVLLAWARSDDATHLDGSIKDALSIRRRDEPLPPRVTDHVRALRLLGEGFPEDFPTDEIAPADEKPEGIAQWIAKSLVRRDTLLRSSALARTLAEMMSDAPAL